MSFIALGINHQTAPVAMREQVAFTPSVLARALKTFAQQQQSAQMVILSTCNRTEIFANSEQISAQSLSEWLSDIHQLDNTHLANHLYNYSGDEALSHLMKVACGLDSLILGEPQILGQVKQAFAQAKHIGTVNGQFEKIFQTTFSVAKKVRSQTDIGANAVSVAYAAVQLAKQIFSNLAKSKVLLIGAGETIELVAKHLSQLDLSKITVANRTLSNAQRLADQLEVPCEAITISEIPDNIALADIVISSTASALPLLGKGTVASALKARKYKPMLMIDLAVPRDIEDQVSELDDVYLYTVDDLQHIVQQNVTNREQAASQATDIIKHQVLALSQWQSRLDKIDLIKAYRDEAETLRQQLEQKALVKLHQGEDAQKVIKELSYKLSQSMMHNPTKAMQKAIAEPDSAALSLLQDVFAHTKSNDN